MEVIVAIRSDARASPGRLGHPCHARHSCEELVKPGSRNILEKCQRDFWAILHPYYRTADSARRSAVERLRV
jgi:hypothetical protein